MSIEDKILKVSLEYFSQKGYSQVRISDIAKEADIGKGTVYLYFNSKRDLFYSTIEYAFRKLSEILWSDKDFKSILSLRAFVYDYFDNWELASKLGSLVLDGLSLGDKTFYSELRSMRDKYIIEDLDKIVRNLTKANIIREINERVISLFIWGNLVFFTTLVLKGEEIKLDKKEIWQMIFSGLTSGLIK
ncbi:transcriptional regulator, TetR family [Thermodesulfobium narugense DSM 14796]|uniref:Transcriptional regulator, TetR family n=1 Tax=Thermodesulfobium narugense DSM 14796 TaxID=747365 RepID=M1E841_9BACT|nr:TetR/AcrR family transcriptional regulator [Thermodesulfobium narugense]AEE14745.1 transcriptional regulator, TetR family [Thermodesulfobium narugense DSM 14796]